MAAIIVDNTFKPPSANAEKFTDDASSEEYYLIGDIRYPTVEPKIDPPLNNFLGAVINQRRWRNGVVPIKFASNATSAFQSNVEKAFGMWDAAGVGFSDASNSDDYAIFEISSKHNDSWVGRKGRSQTVRIKNWDDVSVIAHEIGHLFGLEHEHQRGDRDTYITVNKDILLSGYQEWFEKNDNIIALTEYDLGSLMHYAQKLPDFAYKDGKSEAVFAVNSGVKGPPHRIGYAPRPSAMDIAALKKHYREVIS